MWRLEWEDRQYCVKAARSSAPADVADLMREASLHGVLPEHGYPVARVLWVDEDPLLVTEWVGGPSLAQISAEPHSEERLRRIGQCIEGLAHLEAAEPIFRQHIGNDRPTPRAASSVAAAMHSAVRTLTDVVVADRAEGLLRELAESICAVPSSLGIADITPDDVVLGASGPVFLDIGVLACGWPESRFCQYFARGQQDRADRSDQSRRLLQLLPRPDDARLDAHYLYHDLVTMLAWHDLAVEVGAHRVLRDGRTPAPILAAAGRRATWTGACPAANEVRQRLEQAGLLLRYSGADRA